jgi:hypothetical protein
MRPALYILVSLLAPAIELSAQISPGELSAAHASLEGMDNCTSCHELGRSVESRRCLSCHKELNARITAKRGFHTTLGGRECIACHKEHHGRDFDLIRMDEKVFDHSAVGFPLEGKHRRTGCRSCHKGELIRDADVAKSSTITRSRTYLGLSRECAACHSDPHAGALTGNCTKCHSLESWKPAPGFSHERTKFPLTGRHATVKCEPCHAKRTAEGIRVVYAGLAFGACSDCHADPHKGKLPGACSGCHTTADWRAAGKSFDHAKTRFPLKGKHGQVACFGCHKNAKGGSTPAGSFAIARFSRCSDCHANPHGSQFGERKDQCSSCHGEQGWKPTLIPSFDHAKTKFPLRGKHAAVPCALCHVEKKPLPVRITRVDTRTFGKCTNCHADPHQGQFSGRADGGKCDVCHSESGFTPSTYTPGRHTEARFQITGGHEAVPCDRCHSVPATGGARSFRWASLPACGTCHRDVHLGKFPMRSGEGCATCHGPASWTSFVYDHERTKFPLVGKHRNVPCSGCHRKGAAQSAAWTFAGTPSACAACHVNGGLKL